MATIQVWPNTASASSGGNSFASATADGSTDSAVLRLTRQSGFTDPADTQFTVFGLPGGFDTSKITEVDSVIVVGSASASDGILPVDTRISVASTAGTDHIISVAGGTLVLGTYTVTKRITGAGTNYADPTTYPFASVSAPGHMLGTTGGNGLWEVDYQQYLLVTFPSSFISWIGDR